MGGDFFWQQIYRILEIESEGLINVKKVFRGIRESFLISKKSKKMLRGGDLFPTNASHLKQVNELL